jgi:hypothetical protein
MIYVDEIEEYPTTMIALKARRFGQRWCHLTADTDDELRAFAVRIGCRRSWFQGNSIVPHYDLTPTMRSRAIDAGAQPVSAMDRMRKIRENLK